MAESNTSGTQTAIDACLDMTDEVANASGVVQGMYAAKDELGGWALDAGAATAAAAATAGTPLALVTGPYATYELAQAPEVGAHAADHAIDTYYETVPVAEQRWETMCDEVVPVAHNVIEYVSDLHNPFDPPAHAVEMPDHVPDPWGDHTPAESPAVDSHPSGGFLSGMFGSSGGGETSSGGGWGGGSDTSHGGFGGFGDSSGGAFGGHSSDSSSTSWGSSDSSSHDSGASHDSGSHDSGGAMGGDSF